MSSLEEFGIEQMTYEDRAYEGSRFSEVQEALFANPYQIVWGREGEKALPVHAVTLDGVLRGILPFGFPTYSGERPNAPSTPGPTCAGE